MLRDPGSRFWYRDIDIQIVHRKVWTVIILIAVVKRAAGRGKLHLIDSDKVEGFQRVCSRAQCEGLIINRRLDSKNGAEADLLPHVDCPSTRRSNKRSLS